MKEDIAKKVCIACGKCNELKADCYLAKNIACVLDGENYRKIPQNAVVLTKEELDSKHIFDDEMFLKVLDAERGLGRKEVAREIYAKLLGYFPIDKQFTTLSRYTLDNIFKEIGVEVE